MIVSGRWTASIALALAGAAASGCGPRDAAHTDVAWDAVDAVFVQVDIISMETEAVLREHAVAIRDGRIAWIGAASDVPGTVAARRIAGAGRYLLPGLADVHVHATEADLPLFLAAGVTTVLFKHGDSTHLALRAAAANGELLAPRILTTGPLIAGRPIHWPHVVAGTGQAAAALVREQAAAGYDYIKVYDFLSADAYEGLAAAARDLGIPFIGHVPDAVGLAGVIAAGQRCIDHAEQLIYGTFGRGRSMEVPLTELDTVVAALRGHDVCLTSTLFGMKAMMRRGTSWSDSLYVRPEMRFVDPGIRDWWSSFRGAEPSEEDLARRDHFYQLQVELTRRLHEAGTAIVAGSDTPNLLLVPGYSLHDELGVLVADVGLTPFEAIHSATVNAAAALGAADEFGTVAAGKSADLILVDGNPLEDLSRLRRPSGVMVRGQWLARADLERILESVASR